MIGGESDLLRRLQPLEVELHRLDTRWNRSRLESLLHPEFTEIGRSGREYGRNEILDEFADGRSLPPVHAQDFAVAAVAPGVALLTYRSAHVDAGGKLSRWTLRASLWVETGSGWQMRFHQGKPADENPPVR